MPIADTNALTPVVRIPRPEEHLEAAFHTHGYQQEALVVEYTRIRKQELAKVGEAEVEEFNGQMAEFDVKQFLSTDEARRKASQELAKNSTSPIVSKETQIAVLKQLVQDFFKGKKRSGLTAHTALKAMELLNKMCGYDAPVEQKLTHEHKVTAIPVIQTPFVGTLPPLNVIDVPDSDIHNHGRITIAIADEVADEISPETAAETQNAENDLTLF